MLTEAVGLLLGGRATLRWSGPAGRGVRRGGLHRRAGRLAARVWPSSRPTTRTSWCWRAGVRRRRALARARVGRSVSRGDLEAAGGGSSTSSRSTRRARSRGRPCSSRCSTPPPGGRRPSGPRHGRRVARARARARGAGRDEADAGAAERARALAELGALVERVEAVDPSPARRRRCRASATRLRHVDALLRRRRARRGGAAQPRGRRGRRGAGGRGGARARGGRRASTPRSRRWPRSCGTPRSAAGGRARRCAATPRPRARSRAARRGRGAARTARATCASASPRLASRSCSSAPPAARPARAAAGRRTNAAALDGCRRGADGRRPRGAGAPGSGAPRARRPGRSRGRGRGAPGRPRHGRRPARRSRSRARRSGVRGGDAVELLAAANPGPARAPLARGGVGRRAVARRAGLCVAGPRERGRGARRSSSTRSTPASAASRPARSARSCAALARSTQVVCVTHLPQIAALADRHFRVVKEPGEPTVTRIERLAGREVVRRARAHAGRRRRRRRGAGAGSRAPQRRRLRAAARSAGGLGTMSGTSTKGARWRAGRKYVFITGGVVSSLGKGITAASLGRLLKARGLKVGVSQARPVHQRRPGHDVARIQHGEVFVTEDGAETDLDLGHYERFIDENTSRLVERHGRRDLRRGHPQGAASGEYLGSTVQVIPHVTDEIKRAHPARSPRRRDLDVVLSRSAARSATSRACRSSRPSASCARSSAATTCAYVHVHARAADRGRRRAEDEADAALGQRAAAHRHHARRRRLPLVPARCRASCAPRSRSSPTCDERDVIIATEDAGEHLPGAAARCASSASTSSCWSASASRRRSRPERTGRSSADRVDAPDTARCASRSSASTSSCTTRTCRWSRRSARRHPPRRRARAGLGGRREPVARRRPSGSLADVDGVLIPGGFGGRGHRGQGRRRALRARARRAVPRHLPRHAGARRSSSRATCRPRGRELDGVRPEHAVPGRRPAARAEGRRRTRAGRCASAPSRSSCGRARARTPPTATTWSTSATATATRSSNALRPQLEAAGLRVGGRVRVQGPRRDDRAARTTRGSWRASSTPSSSRARRGRRRCSATSSARPWSGAPARGAASAAGASTGA